jgi:WS/DGAT/MGAT family acyltransferase
MAHPDRERMSSIDTAWLRMDRPYNIMAINGVLIFEDRLDLECVKELVKAHMIRYKRFRQRPIHTSGGYVWETDIHFELSSHVRRMGLPGAGGKEELEELVSNLISTPMDPSKPLWDFHLVEDYQGGSALIVRIQHCYGDGMAMIQVLLSLTNMAPGIPTDSTGPAALISRHNGEEARGDIFRQLFEPVSEAVTQAIKAGRNLLGDGVDIVRHPSETLGYARQGLGLLSEAAKFTVMPDDPVTRFRGKLSVAKRVAWAEPLSLKEVKTIGKALGCSINDVLLSCVTGALRGYLLEKGDTVRDGLEVRAAVPVNLRSLEKAKNLGNFFGLVLLSLPIGVADPVQRVYTVKQRMMELKGSYQAVLTLGLLGTLGVGPKLIQASAMKALTKKATAVMSNVPGPDKPLYMGGAKLSELMFWVPQSGSVGMGVSIFSYNGRVHFGLRTDARLVKDPDTVIKRFNMEFEKVLLAVMMQPWHGQPEAKTLVNPS